MPNIVEPNRGVHHLHASTLHQLDHLEKLDVGRKLHQAQRGLGGDVMNDLRHRGPVKAALPPLEEVRGQAQRHVVGLQVLGAPFDFFSLLGLLSLAGVIINNGIVLIDSIENLNADPATSRAEALVEGTVSRFRPILMSAITTMLGVMPIILVRDPLFYSMATVIAFGLAFGTVLSLLVVPVIYAIFFGVRVGGR